MEMKKRPGLKGEFRKCKTCEKEFYAIPAQVKRNEGKFCSTSCSNKSRDMTHHLGKYAKKGCVAPKTCFKKAKKTFKGTLSEYKYLHYKINKLFGKPDECEFCGESLNNKPIEWANKSGSYTEDRGDWLKLCKKCHWNYDEQYKRMYSDELGKSWDNDIRKAL